VGILRKLIERKLAEGLACVPRAQLNVVGSNPISRSRKAKRSRSVVARPR
jgi:hypothetical protein